MIESAYRSLFWLIYYLPWSVALLAPAVVLLLRGADVFLRRREEEAARRERRVLFALFLAWIGAAAAFTLLFRAEHAMEPKLEPFAALKRFLDNGKPEELRGFWMNVLLFVPGGICLSGALSDRDPERPFFSALLRTAGTVGVCLALSLTAESR